MVPNIVAAACTSYNILEGNEVHFNRRWLNSLDDNDSSDEGINSPDEGHEDPEGCAVQTTLRN